MIRHGICSQLSCSYRNESVHETIKGYISAPKKHITCVRSSTNLICEVMICMINQEKVLDTFTD